MAILLGCTQLKKSYATRELFADISFGIESGDRIGLIGPNGAGKSTLLRIMAGLETPDKGTISQQRGLKVGMLEQIPEFAPNDTVESAVTTGISGAHDWVHLSRVQEYISRLSLDANTPVARLSGGWKKRVALARLFVGDHDLLLLDEPTNHLDVENILWLESFLANESLAFVTVTHDRLFLQRVSNRILELDRRNPGGLLSVKGSYADYLETKEQLMAAQENREVTLKNTLRRETEWLRQGVMARGTKQNARIKQADKLKQEVEELEYRNTVWTAKMDFHSRERNPQKLIEAKGISKSYGDQKLFENIDLLITPGSRLGLLGANGCGKTTLIKVLIGQEKTDTGLVNRSDQLQVVYFEQHRETLNPNLTVAQTIAPSGDHVKYRDNYIHLRGYLDRFNFTTTQMNMKIGNLSGGEQSRLLIAKLMLKPANVLILDEPTNDLDMATLKVLEKCLLEFVGAVILVTHDRYFLDQVANMLLAFGEPDGPNAGKVVSFASLEQWEKAYNYEQAEKRARKNALRKKSDKVVSQTTGKRKLSFKEQYEFDHMESNIHKAEEKLKKLQAESVLPEVISNASRLAEIVPEIEALEAKIDQLYKRWAELDSN
ncbi:MAG: ABC-F family ATP-binding cassette domain-containing protein [Pseudomonadota bacterium]